MAFPTLNAQQEINNRKILEDLQIKKQLLQKGVTVPVVTSSIPTTPNTPLQNTSFQTQTEATLNSPARTAWNQANTLSFGYFIGTDSFFGNNILPVLPRFDNPPPAK